MELVYLWVEKYKNIEKQGFHFSPQFECNYNPDTNELTIDENDDYIENFFGDNINVTAIVGKNGSGKSSVLFQEEGKKAQEWTKGFKIVFKNNTLELIEPFRTFWDEKKSPYAKVFNIKNNTKYLYEKVSIHKSINLNDINKQYSLGESEYKKIDDDYSIYFDEDILKYLNTEKLNDYRNGTYGFSHQNPNSITFFIQEDANVEEDGSLIYFDYKVNTNTLENKIRKIINDIQLDFSEILGFKINLKKNNFLFQLSHGQRSLLLFLSLLIEKINVLDRSLIIYLDELDITLHPKWQKQFINTLIKLLKQTNKNHDFHLVVTSHSPFLLSDIPKQNIIFLDTYKKEDEEVKNGKQKVGNCKVVDGLNDKKQTFGANIHTLLSDSFFMEDGLMGEFAKNKIRTIKVAHRYVLHKHKRKILFTQSCKRCRRLLIKRLPKFWQIQNIIGEPFLQKIVKNQLEEIELILLGKNEAIDKEIARLQALKEGR